MTNTGHKHLLAISVTLLLIWVGTSAEAARSARGLASLTVGYRFESGTLASDLTGSVSADSRLYRGIALFGAVDLHRIQTFSWRSSGGSIGVGGWVGVKLRVSPRNPGVKLSPGVAIGVLALPSGRFGPGQFGSVRFSLDLALVPKEGAGMLLEVSAIQVFSGERNMWGSYPDPLISLRVGMIIRSF